MTFRFRRFVLLLQVLVLSVILVGASAPQTKATPKKKTVKSVKTVKKEEVESQSSLPWSLRDNYIFPLGKAMLRYAVDNAEWSLILDGAGSLIENAGASITLGDGTVLDVATLGKGTTSRESFKTPIGDGSDYWIEFPAKNGLVVRHSIGVHKTRPYYLLRLRVTNSGSTPVAIAKLSPVVLAAGHMGNFSPKLDVYTRRSLARGPYRVFDKESSASLMLFNDREHDITLSLGTLSSGVAASGARLQASGTQWQGDISSVYDPPRILNPGETLLSDPVWFTFSVPDPAQIDMYYAWAHSVLSRPPSGKESPECWVTIPDGAPAEALYKAARNWGSSGAVASAVVSAKPAQPPKKAPAATTSPATLAPPAQASEESQGTMKRWVSALTKPFKSGRKSPASVSASGDAVASTDAGVSGTAPEATVEQPVNVFMESSPSGVQHVLVPAGWESVPGSFEGASPGYPKDISKVAAELKRLHKKPGLTIDPLAVKAGEEPWTTASEDGRRWVNVSVAEGHAQAVSQMKKMAAWGFDFFVVRPSTIPAEVLRRFNMTRAQADTLAFAIMAEAAPGAPVLASSKTTLKADLDTWLEAAAGSSRLKEYEVVSGPVRLDVSGVQKLESELQAALSFFGGPIELIGDPSREMRDGIEGLFPRQQILVRPLDIAKATPRLWYVRMSLDASIPHGAALVAFPGASAWDVSVAEGESDKPSAVWRPENGAFVLLNEKNIPATERFSVYNLSPKLSQPIILDASSGPNLRIHDVSKAEWNESTGAFSGQFDDTRGGTRIAYVVVPDQWVFESGKVGGTPIRGKESGMLVALNINGGKSASFEMTFKRK